MSLQSHTLLVRTSGIGVRIESTHTIEVNVNSQREIFYNNALVILAIFTQPLSLSDGLKKLQIAGSEDWIQQTSIIKKLWLLGALSNYAEQQHEPDTHSASFGLTPAHVGILNDMVLTNSFIKAIQQNVRKGDVVLNIGTGTGAFAIAAARTGAKKVYTIEPGDKTAVVQAIIKKTEVAEKITVVSSKLTQIELHEKADVLISEIIGNAPFDENFLEAFKYARQRLIKPGACILPGKIEIVALPVKISAGLLHNRILQDEDIENWQSWYEIDFSAMKNMMIDKSRSFLKVDPLKAKGLKLFNEPAQLAEVNFETFEGLVAENQITAAFQHPFNGLLVYFVLTLGETVFTNNPYAGNRSDRWLTPVWYFPEAGGVKAGKKCLIKYTYSGNNSKLLLVH